MEKFQFLQNISQIGVVVFSILALLSGYGSYYYGQKKEELKKVVNTPIEVISAPNALIATQNQIGNNTLNVTHISDSFGDGKAINEISYPTTGEFGTNILDRNTHEYKEGTFSMRALIPEHQSLMLEISGTNWGFPAFQAMPGWRHFDARTIGETTSRKFKTVKFGNADLEFCLTGVGEIKISVYENDNKTPTWEKTIKVESK